MSGLFLIYAGVFCCGTPKIGSTVYQLKRALWLLYSILLLNCASLLAKVCGEDGLVGVDARNQYDG